MAKKIAPPTHRAHIYYSGRVQGVGFRHIAEEVAHRVGVLGFVKNLQDRRVEVVCEGSKEKIDAYLSEIQNSVLGKYIQKADCNWEQPSGTFTDFMVEFQY